MFVPYSGMSIEWKNVQKILIVRLRSIGDTVLTTPSLIALRRFLPNATIDILLEDWVAPVLDGFDEVDSVLSISKSTKSRVKTAREIRRAGYDVAVNLHGGTTATFFVRASGARDRVGYSHYSYSFLYNHRLASPTEFWRKEKTHSAEQQLALLGFVGVPVEDRPKTRLAVTDAALASLDKKLLLETSGPLISPISRGDHTFRKFALIHPTASFETKQWAVANFARVGHFLKEKGLTLIAVATKSEQKVLDELRQLSNFPILTFDDLSLPEITALASRARLFVGNDSGIAHIAAAVETPSVVIFGSSNRNHWRPWTNAPNEIVYEKMSCQPCPGLVCKEYGEPKCILNVKPVDVCDAIDRLLENKKK